MMTHNIAYTALSQALLLFALHGSLVPRRGGPAWSQAKRNKQWSMMSWHLLVQTSMIISTSRCAKCGLLHTALALLCSEPLHGRTQ